MSQKVIAILLLLSFFAAYAKYYLSFLNGFFGLLSVTADTKSLPGLPDQLYYNYTGIRPLDKFLAACNVFFWPIFQGATPGLAMYGVAFATGMIPMWLVIVFETYQRKRPLAALTELTFVAGPLIQCLGPGLVMPAMLARICMSAHHTNIPSGPDPGSFSLSMVLGYILPLSFAALPTPAVVTYYTKQKLIAFWQGWPLYTSLVMRLLRYLGHAQVSHHEQLKTACAFAFACSFIGHVVFLWFVWAGSASHHVYLPPAPWREAQVTNIEAGMLRFLQWDYTIAALAMLVWVVAFYRQGTRQNCRQCSWASLIAGIAGVIFLGPCSVAIVLYWETLETKRRQSR